MQQWQRIVPMGILLTLSACSGGGGEQVLPKQTTYAIGGSVSGLIGTGLVLANGSDRATITANGAFQFRNELPSGTRYNISVATQPIGQQCSITNHDAVVGSAAVNNITVSCSDSLFTLGGMITGLAGSGLELQNNGGDNRVIDRSESTYSFARTFTSGTAYNVTVLRHPTSPAQYCEATNATGSIVNSNITSVAINCISALLPGSSSPIANSSGVNRDITPTMTFSTSLNAGTATTTNVSLSSAAGAHPITPTASGTQLSLAPTRLLLPATAYTVNIGTGVRGAGGERLVSAVTFGFTTRDGQWQGRQLAETVDIGGIVFPQVALGANGDGFSVWTQNTANPFPNVYVNRYQPGTGWGVAAPLDTGSANNPQVAVDATGGALAVWLQNNGTRVNVMASRYANSAWSQPIPIDANDNYDANAPRLAMDANGNAIAIWIQYDGNANSLYANRYANGTWNGAVLLETSNNTAPRDTTIVCGENGQAIAAWAQPETQGGMETLYANRFTPSGGWSGAVPIEADAGAAFFPSAAVDPAGNALVVWQQVGSIVANRFVVGSGWGQAAPINVAMNGASIARVGLDAAGNAMAVWTQIIGTRNAVHANRFSLSSGWGLPAPISDPAVGHAYDPQIVVDKTGNALAVWDQETSTINQARHLHTNRYVLGSGWSTATLLDTDAASSTSPRMAIDASGNALLVWQQSDGTRNNVYSNRFQ